MTSEPAAQSQPTSVRARRRARIAARIAQRENYFDLLASGYSCPQIADAAKVSVATVQRAIDRAIAERRLDAPDRYMHLQVARLTKALRLADASIENGDLKAVAPLTRLVAALDRYHGLGAVKAHWRPAPTAPLPTPAAPPLALPAPPLALTPPRRASTSRCGNEQAPEGRWRGSSEDSRLRAESAPTRVASGRTGVRAIAAIRLRARNSLHRP